jgi:RHS repeat-associated protein
MNKAQSESYLERRKYSAYGHDPVTPSSKVLLGFNGEHLHRASTSYYLGNGYRSYSPLLLRFCSPDSWSPFGRGGLNAYCYCGCDPVNNSDPSGHTAQQHWRASTVPNLAKIRASELNGNRVDIRALENHIYDIDRTNLRLTRFPGQVRMGNRYLPDFPSQANPNPERPPEVNRDRYWRPTEQTLQPDIVKVTSARQIATLPSRVPSRGSSPSSTDSWDEWRPNPEVVERQSNAGIMEAIRRAGNPNT